MLGTAGVDAGFAPGRPPDTIASTVVAVSLVVVLFTLVCWGLDMHWRGFLYVSVATAKRLEQQLQLTSPGWGITKELDDFAAGGRGRWVYHFFYLMPASSAIVALTLVQLLSPLAWWLFFPHTILVFVVVVVAACFYMKVAPDRAKGFVTGRVIVAPGPAAVTTTTPTQIEIVGQVTVAVTQPTSTGAAEKKLD